MPSPLLNSRNVLSLLDGAHTLAKGEEVGMHGDPLSVACLVLYLWW